MEKILLAVDAVHPSSNALEFACYLGRTTHSKVTAVFLENLVADISTTLHPAYLSEKAAGAEQVSLENRDSKIKLIEENIERFKNACINREVNYNLARDRGLPLTELIKESRYADVMVLDATTNFGKQFEGTPSQFVKKVLSHTECPVIIAPETFDGITELVFAYDGSASSVFALKQFTHIFPQFNDKKVHIVEVTNDENKEDPDKYMFKKWLQAHYNDFHFELLQGNTVDQLFEYLFLKKNIFIVMGAYGRNFLSRFFKPGPAGLIIKTITQPIFIAHSLL